MTCCKKALSVAGKAAHIVQGNFLNALDALFLLPQEKSDNAQERLRICFQCDHRTWLYLEEYAAWLKDHSVDVLKNIDHLESLPPLEKKELVESSKQRLFCQLCKCWIPAKVYVVGERCPRGKWL